MAAVGNAVFQERVLLTDYFSRYFEDRVGTLIEATDQPIPVVKACIEECFLGRVIGETSTI